jgi:hypothetical protein
VASSGVIPDNDKILLTLSSPVLDHYLLIATSLMKALEIAERPFSDGRVDELVAELPAQIAAAQAAAAAASTLANNVAPDASRNLIDRDEALMQKATLEIQKKYALTRIGDARELLQIAKTQLAEETSYLSDIKNSLIFRADGGRRFKPYVAAGSFIRRGQICGEVEK